MNDHVHLIDMPVYNPIYTRQWTKMFAPISTLMNQIGKQIGWQTIINRNDTLIEMNTMSSNESHPFSTFLASLISSFRPQVSSISTYGKQSTRFHSKYSRNGLSKSLHVHTMNDENNNHQQIEPPMNANSIIIDLPSSLSDECLIKDTTEKLIFTTEHYFWILFLTILYFTWFIFIAGISVLHVLIYLILISLYLLSERTRRFALAILIYLSYLLVYDALHVIPNYTVSQVHIEDIYLLEKKVFGVISHGKLMTLNEYFKVHHKPLLDIFTGICYLNWIPIPLVYSLYLYRYKSKRDYMDFAFTFLLTNLLGFVVYYIVPAAPPWYIELYGFNMNIKTPGSPAGFKNFDHLTGIKLFSSMYSKNANVFAALPSLHAAYPVITVLYGSLSKKLWLHIGFVLFTLSVWFSAVYSRHHYVLDVLAGGTCAITAYLLYRLLSRIPAINRLLISYSKLI